MTIKRWSSFCLVLCLVAACIGRKDRSTDTGAETKFKSSFGAIREADQLTFYEGLPHQLFESKQMEEEKRTKETISLNAYPFYREPMELSPEDKDTLQKVLGNEKSFAPWGGEKKCGGFHPDYCTECYVGANVHRFLICFGCQEVKVFGPEDSLRCDIRSEPYKQLEVVLKKYKKNRPRRALGM